MHWARTQCNRRVLERRTYPSTCSLHATKWSQGFAQFPRRRAGDSRQPRGRCRRAPGFCQSAWHSKAGVRTKPGRCSFATFRRAPCARQRRPCRHWLASDSSTCASSSSGANSAPRAGFKSRSFHVELLGKETSSGVEHWDRAKDWVVAASFLTNLCNAFSMGALRVREALSHRFDDVVCMFQDLHRTEPVRHVRFVGDVLNSLRLLPKHGISSMHSVPRLTSQRVRNLPVACWIQRWTAATSTQCSL